MEAHEKVSLVHDEATLRAMVLALEAVPRVAIDTEFHAEHRYRPELMLVQIAAPTGEVWVIDPRAFDIRALATVLERQEIVVHGGQQDIELLYRSTGALPPRLFDTQRAAALVGMGYPTRLGTVVHRTLGEVLNKAASLTDWSTRPLTARQLQYAAEDARVLLPLAAGLEALLEPLGRAAWAWEASQELCAEVHRPPPELDAWLQWEIAASLDEPERQAMRALFVWRDATARHADQPPRQILSDALALDLARRRPASIADLGENRRVPQGLIKRHGAPILATLKRAEHETEPAPAPPSTEAALLANLIEHWAALVDRERGLARNLVMPRSLATRVATEGHEALSGWRAAALGEDLRALLEGRHCIGVRGQISAILDQSGAPAALGKDFA